MTQPFVGEIRMFGGNFAPAGWMLCLGQILPISSYDTLFNLIGTTYGGDGQSTFALPDLQGRVPLHSGSNGQNSYVIGESGGSEAVALSNGQIASHAHGLPTSDASATLASPVGAIPAAWSSDQYGSTTTGAMAPAVQFSGGNLPHDNMVPFLAVNFIISLFGVFPSAT
jgi:microcystin-dependent protein